jgi:hypothetical protein
MVNRKTAVKIRKTHRYLGIFLGIQFLMWTISGLYFSWTDIDEIHGDQFMKTDIPESGFTGLMAPPAIQSTEIRSLNLRDIGGEPYYWVNNQFLVHARTGKRKEEISRQDALAVAQKFMMPGMEVAGLERITEVGDHHEYRGRPLPAWVINYNHPEALKAYVSAKDGSFQRVRHRSWRWFDFLWMTHTMDYQGRDNFNTLLLRAFSLLGLITVLSGFTLWFTSSPTVRKLFK